MRCSWLRLHLLSLTAVFTASTALLFGNATAEAQIPGYCQSSRESAVQKEELLKQAVKGNQAAKQRYQSLVKQSAESLRNCRARSWPRTQAIWLRLYECDLKPGVLDSLMDRLVSRGYNRVNIEVFYGGQVLLPANDNPTVWRPVVRKPEFAQRDLLAEAMQKARERGIQPYAWTFSMNFGYEYGNRPDRKGALARNGKGKTSATLISSTSPNVQVIGGDIDKVFVDPYSPQARRDFGQMLGAIAKRKPNGVLFDYIRYPRQTGGASVVANTRDLWIFGRASQNVLLSRATNAKGKAVLQHYLTQGGISASSLAAFDKRYPNDGAALWQGRQVPKYTKLPSAGSRIVRLRHDLWLLTVAHAYQGVVDFLTAAARPVQQQGMRAGAVFFPGANRRVGKGFDSRMQPWDQFPKNIEWSPMAYAVCGNSNCIAKQVQDVLATAPSGTQVTPAIAGAWGGFSHNRPSLENQMQAIRRVAPQVQTVSHFDFSWQDPLFANARRSCRVDYGR